MTGYMRADRTVGSELIEIICIFTIALLLCWAASTSTEGAELLQENNTEGVGDSLEPLERSERGERESPHH